MAELDFYTKRDEIIQSVVSHCLNGQASFIPSEWPAEEGNTLIELKNIEDFIEYGNRTKWRYYFLVDTVFSLYEFKINLSKMEHGNFYYISNGGPHLELMLPETFTKDGKINYAYGFWALNTSFYVDVGDGVFELVSNTPAKARYQEVSKIIKSSTQNFRTSGGRNFRISERVFNEVKSGNWLAYFEKTELEESMHQIKPFRKK